MQRLATTVRPLRIAIIGAGPAGLYATEALLNKGDIVLTIDVFNRFPTPFGLVRDGVAPDHQSIKAVTRVLGKALADPRVRFFGNVTYGVDIHHKDLKRFYDQILYAVGAQADRRMSIPGEDLHNSFSASRSSAGTTAILITAICPSTSPASAPSSSATATSPWTSPACWSPPRTRC
jgi:ferredoxin--NADP+ reductase